MWTTGQSHRISSHRCPLTLALSLSRTLTLADLRSSFFAAARSSTLQSSALSTRPDGQADLLGHPAVHQHLPGDAARQHRNDVLLQKEGSALSRPIHNSQLNCFQFQFRLGVLFAAVAHALCIDCLKSFFLLSIDNSARRRAEGGNKSERPTGGAMQQDKVNRTMKMEWSGERAPRGGADAGHQQRLSSAADR